MNLTLVLRVSPILGEQLSEELKLASKPGSEQAASGGGLGDSGGGYVHQPSRGD